MVRVGQDCILDTSPQHDSQSDVWRLKFYKLMVVMDISRILICLIYLIRMLTDILDFVTDYPYCWVHFWVVPFIRLWPYFSHILVLYYGSVDEVWSEYSQKDLECSQPDRP